MTGFLLGQSNHSLDAKGRLIIPIRLREGLGSHFFMCNGHGGNHIQIYPMDQWLKFANSIAEKDLEDEDNRYIMNYFFASAVECEPDAQYRIVIPQSLRDEMNIDKEVVLVGNLTSVQLWSKEAWEAQYEKSRKRADEKFNNSQKDKKAVEE